MVTMRATWPAAFEARTATRTAAATIGSTGATIFAPTVVAAAIIAIAPATTVRSLETGPRIAADARGIAREILPRLGGAGARGACFAWKQDGIVLCDGRLGRGFGSGGFDGFAASLFVGFWLFDGSCVQRAFVRRIRFCFAERMRIKSASLDSVDLFCAYVLRLGIRFACVNLFVFLSLLFDVRFFLLVLFFFSLFESGAPHECVG
jgi:hypothetical protein